VITLYFNLARFQTFKTFHGKEINNLGLTPTWFAECTLLTFNNVHEMPTMFAVQSFLNKRIDLYRIVSDRYDDYHFNENGYPPTPRDVQLVYESVVKGIMALLLDVKYSYIQYHRPTSLLNLTIKGQYGELVI
jgi:hypothetical protein